MNRLAPIKNARGHKPQISPPLMKSSALVSRSVAAEPKKNHPSDEQFLVCLPLGGFFGFFMAELHSSMAWVVDGGRRRPQNLLRRWCVTHTCYPSTAFLMGMISFVFRIFYLLLPLFYSWAW